MRYTYNPCILVLLDCECKCVLVFQKLAKRTRKPRGSRAQGKTIMGKSVVAYIKKEMGLRCHRKDLRLWRVNVINCLLVIKEQVEQDQYTWRDALQKLSTATICVWESWFIRTHFCKCSQLICAQNPTICTDTLSDISSWQYNSFSGNIAK